MAGDFLTNAADLTISGTNSSLGTNETIQISRDGGLTWAQATVSGTSWSYGLTGLTSDTSVQVRILDANGLAVISTSRLVRIDSTGPSAGTLFPTGLNDSGTAGDLLTSDNAFGLSLVGANDANGIASTTYQISSDGSNWTATSANQSGLGDGTYFFQAVVTDNVGNSSFTPSLQLKIDRTAPTAGTMGAVDLVDTGFSNADSLTSDNDFTLSPPAADDLNGIATIAYEMSLNGSPWATTPQAQTKLLDGAYQFRAVVFDNAGNSTTSAPFAVVVDNLAPTPGSFSLNGFSDTGLANNDNLSSDTQFSLAAANQTDANGVASVVYEVFDGNQVDQTWSTTLADQAITQDGAYSFRALITDNAGNTSLTKPITITIDTTAPTIGSMTLLGLLDTGASDQDKITSANSFALEVTASESNGGANASYQTSSNGITWSECARFQNSISDGTHYYQAIVTDTAGNSSRSTPIQVTVDTTAPTIGQFSFVDFVDTGDISDPIPVTTDRDFALNLINSFDTQGISSTVFEESNDGVQWTPINTNARSGLADGSYFYRAVLSDIAGNSTTSNPIGVVVDTTNPIAGTLTFGNFTAAAASNSIPIINSGSIDLTLNGAADANPVQTHYQMSKDGGAWTDTGSSSLSELADGHYQFKAIVIDKAGLTAESNVLAAVVDTTAPQPPTITSVIDNAGRSTGSVSPDGSTDDTTPEISGTAEAGSSIDIYSASTLLGQTTADGTTGAWSFTPSSALSLGTYTFTATATDAAGNTSPPSTGYTITVTEPPAPPAPTITDINDNAGRSTGSVNPDGSTDDTTPQINGTAEAGSTINVYDGLTLLGQTTADGTTGAWSFTPSSALSLGTYTFSATATDTFGKTSPPSASYSITVTAPPAPPAPTITGVNDNVGSSQGTVSAGGSTDDTTPEISGTAEAGSSIDIYSASTLLGQTTADGTTGAWSFTPSSALSLGLYTFTATATDAAGLTSTPSASYSITVTAPAVADPIGETVFTNQTPALLPEWLLLLNDPGAADITGVAAASTATVSHTAAGLGTGSVSVTITGSTTPRTGSFTYKAANASGDASSNFATATVTYASTNGTLNGDTGNNIMWANNSLATNALNGGAGNDIYSVTPSGHRAIDITDTSGSDTLVIGLLGGNLSSLSFTDDKAGSNDGSLVITTNTTGGTATVTTVVNLFKTATTSTRSLVFSGGGGYEGYAFSSSPYTLSDDDTTYAGTQQNDVITGDSDANSISGLNGDDLIFGGAKDDNLSGGVGRDLLQGDANNDTFIFATGDSDVSTNLANCDVITDWGNGSDKIAYSVGTTATAITRMATGTGGLTMPTGVVTAGASSLSDFVSKSSSSTTTGAAAIWSTGGNAFLFVSDGIAGLGSNDLLVQLSGITPTTSFTLTSGQISAIA